MVLNIPKIKSILAERGWTAYTLAERLGIRHQWFYSILSGNGQVTLRTVDVFARALNVDGKDLISEE